MRHTARITNVIGNVRRGQGKVKKQWYPVPCIASVYFRLEHRLGRWSVETTWTAGH